MDFGIASVAGITVICYLLGQIVKATGLPGKWIPCIVGVFGGLLGIAGLYVIADFPAAESMKPCSISTAGMAVFRST